MQAAGHLFAEWLFLANLTDDFVPVWLKWWIEKCLWSSFHQDSRLPVKNGHLNVSLICVTSEESWQD